METMTTTTTMRRINFLNRTMDLEERASSSFMTERASSSFMTRWTEETLGSGITRHGIATDAPWTLAEYHEKCLLDGGAARTAKAAATTIYWDDAKWRKCQWRQIFSGVIASKGYTTFSTMPLHPGLYILQAQPSWAFPRWECQVPQTPPRRYGRQDIP